MTTTELIGEVAALFLEEQVATREAELDASEEDDSTARFIIDCLKAPQIAAIARAILRRQALSAKFDVKLPAHYLADENLPGEVLTNERATYYRHAACEKPALLIANMGDDEEQSLRELTPIGTQELRERPDLWVKVASADLPISETHRKWWETALKGLSELRITSLDRLAGYVLRTSGHIDEDGEPILRALGVALPALHLPKDPYVFEGIPEKKRGHKSQWRSKFNQIQKNHAPYLSKQNSSGLLLSEEELSKTYERVKEDIPEEYRPTVEAFISAPSGWNDAAAALAEHEWRLIQPLFDGLRRKKYNWQQATVEFYEELDPDLLSDDERDYLNLLVVSRKTEAEEEDEAFYNAHRTELREDRKLTSAWEKFIYGSPLEVDDFVLGLALALESLIQEAPAVRRRLTIRTDKRSKRDYSKLNVEAGLYFERRYKGLRNLLGPNVTWDVGPLFQFSELVGEWKEKDRKLNQSKARAALRIKFVIALDAELLTGGMAPSSPKQLIWKFNPDWVPSEFVGDWDRLAKHPLVYCRTSREHVSAKGRLQSIDVQDRGTLVAAYGQRRGSLVAVYKDELDIGRHWRMNLEHVKRQGLISEAVAEDLLRLFQVFEDRYASAVRGFIENGVASTDLEGQAEAYGVLLDRICRDARGDSNRERLLRPLMHIGAAVLDGEPLAVIVTPWHPLRMAAMARKARLVARLVRNLLTEEEVRFGDPKLFFKDLAEDLRHPFYPEVVLGWRGGKGELLALIDVAADYTLHEQPVVSQNGADDTNDNPTEGAKQVLELVKRYLFLHPHEQANLSVVLYNCDSARLPLTVVEKMGAVHKDDDEVRCQVILRHRDKSRLSRIYQKIVEASDEDADAFSASEVTRDFMARLRIGIRTDQAPVVDPKDGRPEDIVFSQDVIARHANLGWRHEDARPAHPDELIPSRWSRRRPAARDDMKSVVYLCCPVQTKEGWAYLTALASFIKGDWDENADQRYLPVRELDFRNRETKSIFDETHDLANWVVNYDELLDRRQLINQEVQVIRYKQTSTQGRSLIISSKAPTNLLRAMVQSRLQDLGLELQDRELADLALRFIDDANDISGDIVLRAAKRGRSASELMGVVLSRYLVRSELGSGRAVGWYFLDDYATWLGQREEQIADIMALSPLRGTHDELKLDVVVTEVKYINYANLSAKRKESQRQLRQTMQRINEAIFGSPARMDRDLWLSRLSDLVLDGVHFSANKRLVLSKWRRAIREDDCEVGVRGYSHVFVSGPRDTEDCSARAAISGLENGQQDVFSPNQVRDLVMAYYRNEDPAPPQEDIPPAGDDTGPGPPPEEPVRPPSSSSLPQGDIAPASPDRSEPADPNGSSEAGAVSSLTSRQDIVERQEQEEQASVAVDQGSDVWHGRWAYAQLKALLKPEVETSIEEGSQQWLKQTTHQMKGALQQFHLRAKLISSQLTPNAALLKFAGSDNLTVEQVNRRRSQLLTTHGLEVISVLPEPGIVSIAVARPERQIVHLQEVWAQWKPNIEGGNQELLIAVREDSGELLFLSPSEYHAPHTLIAGSTGSGKSVLMQNILLGIAATNTPEQARITLIDPKQGVDYFAFEALPHLDGGIIDEQDDALERIEALVGEMDRRYRRLREARVPNLILYNRKMPLEKRLPFLWLIHDEFAEWMLVEGYKQEVTTAVARLGVKARAAGIYLVFAAQRPDANVMPMQLRANLGNRLILRVDSEGTSEIALGEKGAERLLGRGHLLAKLEGEASLQFAQVPFVNPVFIERAVTIMAEEAKQKSKSPG